MIKPTPNPPETDPASPYESPDSKQFQEAAERALNHYLNPAANIMAVPHKPSTMFIINPDIDTESLLAHACESLASANVMSNDLAGFLPLTINASAGKLIVPLAKYLRAASATACFTVGN